MKNIQKYEEYIMMMHIQLYGKKECEDCNGKGKYYIGNNLCECPTCEGQGSRLLKDNIISLKKLKELLNE